MIFQIRRTSDWSGEEKPCEKATLVKPYNPQDVLGGGEWEIEINTLEELIEAGTEGLRKGAMKYNFEADYKFIAYAIWWIRQSIIQAITEKKNNK